jgi:hypothetical protein
MIFVGERQSPKAAKYGYTWQSGRACASTLRSALLAAGIDPDAATFLNLWSVPGLKRPGRPPRREVLRSLRRANREGQRIVALGSIVAKELARLAIPHVPLRHPAARGKMRRRDPYEAHVRERLTSPIIREA